MSCSRARKTLVLVAVTLCLLTVGCAKSTSDSGGSAKRSGGTDAYWSALDKAAAAIKAKSGDAVLVTAGSADPSPTAAPKVWTFVYLSPSTHEGWGVTVDKSGVKGPESRGSAPATLSLDPAVAPGDIKISALEAINLARSMAKGQGKVPPNVWVGGLFVKVGDAGSTMVQPGYWHVAFVGGPKDPVVQYKVNMASGNVSPVTQ